MAFGGWGENAQHQPLCWAQASINVVHEKIDARVMRVKFTLVLTKEYLYSTTLYANWKKKKKLRNNNFNNITIFISINNETNSFYFLDIYYTLKKKTEKKKHWQFLPFKFTIAFIPMIIMEFIFVFLLKKILTAMTI